MGITVNAIKEGLNFKRFNVSLDAAGDGSFAHEMGIEPIVWMTNASVNNDLGEFLFDVDDEDVFLRWRVIQTGDMWVHVMVPEGKQFG